MKKILRLLSLVLLCGLLLSMAVSCADDGDEKAPDGMMSANRVGDDFRFYVPTNWNLNTSHGVRGAYYYIDNISSVSVVKYPVTDGVSAALPVGGDADLNGARTDKYWELYCLPAVEGQATGQVAVYDNEARDALLGDAAARRYHMLATVKEQNVHFLQVVTERNNAFYVFTFSAIPELYDMLYADVEGMLKHFAFSDTPYDPEDVLAPIPADNKTPDGMKRASRDGVAYRFYAPAAWQINTTHEVTSVYAEEDGTNVSVVPYLPTETSIGIEDYFKANRAEMERIGGSDSFTLIEEKEITLSGRVALLYDYTWRVGDETYHYRHVVAAYGNAMYNITYTARPAHYEAHLSDFDVMLSAFVFD